VPSYAKASDGKPKEFARKGGFLFSKPFC